MARLHAGAPRDAVAMGFLRATERPDTVVAGHHDHLLGRGIDLIGRAYWVLIVQAGGRDEAIIGGLIVSDEYFGHP